MAHSNAGFHGLIACCICLSQETLVDPNRVLPEMNCHSQFRLSAVAPLQAKRRLKERFSCREQPIH